MAADPTATTRTRIHVGGLGQSVNSDDLRKIFSAVGTVEGVDIVRTKGRSFAYVDILPSTSNSISKLFSTIKSLPFSGTGKHRYSFQRVEALAFPLHFCDCAEHSGRFNAVKQKEVRHHEEINDGMNEEELSLMSSVMNKLFERENISNTSRHAIKTRLSENKVSKDGAIPSASKLQKKNALHAEKKRKPNRDDKHEITSLSSQLRMNSQCDEIEAGFEEDDETDDDLVINVASTENKGKALSGSTKRAKVSPKQNFKSSETQSTENEREEKKDRLLPKKKMKLISTKERDGNEAVSIVPAAKGPLIAQMTEQDCSLKPSSTSCLWSQKSSWKALVGGRGDSAFSLSNMLQNADTTEEQHVFDDPKVDNTLDSKNDKLSTPENLEGMSDKMEIANAIAEAQPNKPSMTSSNTGRGSSWLHKSSWIQLVSDKSNSFSISQILPGTTTSQELAKPAGEDLVQSADGNYTNEMDRFTTEGVGKGDSVESIPKTSPQTLEGSNDTSLPAVENISNFEPVKAFAVDTSTGGTCSFMRSSTSLKEWAKTKAALKGSRKKKTKGDSM
ncbi:hypothetical protein GOBAR_AA39680 [Gossypium barbadense]|uniref:RRM domain-containing protein n=1 Tax=Gossypium barbadense TaxID=3634 RepID=A0A2P5PZK4_GOSBA|nr:hypothetical protein GOBAR_DD35391 [Gossypium barbadense]PPR81032.1 hypothetical protein GOBAR_AA39680 [Gossypium barbadense]